MRVVRTSFVVDENPKCEAQGTPALHRTGDPAALPAAFIDKIRKIIAFLQDMEREDELRTIQSWKAHKLSGDRKGTWSVFVSKNWRITFRIDRAEIEIIDLDYEDYH